MPKGTKRMMWAKEEKEEPIDKKIKKYRKATFYVGSYLLLFVYLADWAQTQFDWVWEISPAAPAMTIRNLRAASNHHGYSGGGFNEDSSPSSSDDRSNVRENNNTTTTRRSNRNKIQNEIPVVDSIQYNGEEVVPVRLELLYDVVDRFYITESLFTFSGVSKPLYSEIHKEQFLPYEDKITWLLYQNPPDFNTTHVQGGMSGDNWRREQLQRQYAVQQMKVDVQEGTLAKDFVIINTDADEVPNPLVLQEFQPGGKWSTDVLTKPMFMDMYWFAYNANWRKNGNWTKAHTLPGSKTISGELNLQQMRNFRLSDRSSDRISEPMGWHLGYFMSIQDIQRKLSSFSHSECNKPRFTNPNHIMDCIKNGKDLFNRPWWVEQLVPFDTESLPEPLQKFHNQVVAKQNGTSTTSSTTAII